MVLCRLDLSFSILHSVPNSDTEGSFMLDAIALGELLIDFATVDTDRDGYPDVYKRQPLSLEPGS